MRFDKHQQELLSTTLQSLVCYVNGRLNLVREIDRDASIDDNVCSELVERYVWEHSYLIDEFVRENPDDLPKTQLDIAAQLTGTLYGSIILESRQGDTTTFLHQTGLYVAATPKGSAYSRLPHEPVELRGALIPFGEIIVALPPFTVLGRTSPFQLREMHANLAASGADHPISDARVLSHRAREWRDQRERIKKERQAYHSTPHVAAGFHRSPLAGLNGSERIRAKAAHYDQGARMDEGFKQAMDLRCVDAEVFPVTLEEGLRLLDDDWICDIAGELESMTMASELPREKLIPRICKRIVEDEEQRDLTLLWCLNAQFELIERLLDSNPLSLDDIAPSFVIGLFPLIPYVFIIREGASMFAWMPPEIRSFISRVNLKSFRELRERMAEVRNAACAMATMCGIVSVADVYERYRRVVDRPLDRRRFEIALDELEICESRDAYALWRHLGTDYVISVEISDASAAARVARESYADCIHEMDSYADDPGLPTIVELTAEDERMFTKRLAKKEAELELKRLSLLERRASLRAHDLPPLMLKGTPIDSLMELDALRSLREFVDCHVPDDEDHYEFADTFTRAVVVSCVLMGESYNDTMDIIRLYHMQGCEGSEFSDTLGQLMTNAFNALPRWELNGWSLEENTERLTGRRRFYGKNGRPLSIADDDECPCGSGRSYGHCCGDLRRDRR